MSEDIDKHVLRKYHVGQKLGKGVCLLPNALVFDNSALPLDSINGSKRYGA